MPGLVNKGSAVSGPIDEPPRGAGERNWPGWSAPLLGAFGAALAGVFLTEEPHFPFTPVQSGLGGAVLGALAGLIVWLKDRPVTTPDEAVLPGRPGDGGSRVSRRPAVQLITLGLAVLSMNHLMVIATRQKLLPLVLGGPFFVAFGLAGCLAPSLLLRRGTAEPPSLWANLIAAVFVLASLGLSGYLWFVIYH
jgi:hypothetical protein